MRKKILLCAVVFAVGQTITQQAPLANEKRQLKKFEKNCRDVGLKPKTIPFKECVRKFVAASKKRSAEGRKRAFEEASDNLGGGS